MGRIAVLLVAVALAPGDFSGARAKQTVEEIAALGPRVAGSAPERRAADLVARRLRALGFRVVVQRFPLPDGRQSRNVVGLAPGPIRAVLTAHVDGVAAGPAANDNASGVATLLEAARVVGPRPGLLVAALGAEERRETGSCLHLGAMRLVRGFSAAGKRRIRVALNLDMVGVGTRLYVRGIEAEPNRSARATGLPYLRDPGHSDHAELTRNGLPAAWVQWRTDACWHRACDTAGRVRADRLAATGRLTVSVLRRALDSR